MISNPTALYRELANYSAEYGVPAATAECVAELIADTDPNDDPQRQGLDMLAARTINELAEEVGRLRMALEMCLAEAECCWLNHYGENPEGSAEPEHIARARAALAEKPTP